MLLEHPQIDIDAVATPHNDTPLQDAANHGHTEVVRMILAHKRGVDINAVDDGGKSALHKAMRLGNMAVVSMLLACPDIEVTIKDEDGDTPLHA